MGALLFHCPDNNRPIVPGAARNRNRHRTWDSSPGRRTFGGGRQGLRLMPTTVRDGTLEEAREVATMRALVMYESMFGNSERVARAVADGLGAVAQVVVLDVTVSLPGDVPGGVDLLVVGGPTHALSMSRPSTREEAIRQGPRHGLVSRGLREWLEGLPADLHALPYAAFDTRVSRARHLPGSAARSAARIVRRHHARQVLAPESFFVDDVAGPLGEEELDRARAWGARVGAASLDDRAPAN